MEQITNITEEERRKRIEKLGAYLNVAGQRVKMIEEITNTAKVNVNNGEIDVKLDKNKISEFKEKESFTPNKQKTILEAIASTSKKTGRDLKAVSSDEINMLLNGGIKAVRENKVTPLLEKNNVEMEQYEENNNQNSYDEIKNKILSDLINDKDLKNEIIETILYELFSKERIKKILKEIIAEKQSKR
jgi:hypothetical protein